MSHSPEELSALLEENRRLREALVRYQSAERALLPLVSSRDVSLWSLLEDLFDGILVHEAGLVVEVSSNAAEFLGYDRSEILGRSVGSFVAPECVAIVDDALHNPPVDSHCLVAQRKNGSRVEVITYGRSLLESGRDLRLVAFRDVSEQRAAERALLSSERHHRFLTENASDVIWMMDLQGNFTYVSPSVQALKGFSVAEAMALSIQQTLTPDSAQRAAEAIASELAHFQKTGEVRTSVVEVEQYCKSGTTIWTEVAAKFLVEQGTVRSVLAVTRDITQRRKSESEKQRILNLEALGRLAGGVAHDFNNILTAILGNISLSRRAVARGLDVDSFLSNAERACARARDLTRQLMAFSKGGAPIRSSASLSEVIQDSISFAATGSPVLCDFDIASDLYPAFVDAAQIAQVLHNMGLNAVQAMPSGGDLRVTARNVSIAELDHDFLRSGRYVCISVSDTGPGISQEVLPKIFDPYFTTREAGTGLGLSTCHAIVSRHEGHIEVESSPELGTTFRVYLPAARSNAIDSPQSSYPARGSGRVLVMDDDAAVREVASLLLSSMGYEVDSAAEGSEAVARYVSSRETGNPFDVVIVDLTVPGGVGGKETLKRLLAIDPNVRVVVASGYSEDPIISDYASAGFRAMITKPFLGGELARAVDKARA